MKKIGLISILLGVFALLVFSGCVSDQETSTGLASAAASTEDSVLSIPLEEISTQAKFFEFDSGGVVIRFFVVKASDGSVKTAFDACDVCYDSKKGYKQEGNYMVCNNCGNKYPIDGLGTENKNPGGCWPTYLPSKVIGDSIIIEKLDLRKGKSMV